MSSSHTEDIESQINPEEMSAPKVGRGNTKAMIFCAGMGTRFKPWTDTHPKALAIVNGKSLLQRNIEYLQSYGISDIVINVHHFAAQIEKAIQDNDGWGSNIEISDEREILLETGGGLLKAQHLLNNGHPFLCLNADILTDLNLNDLINFHHRKNAFISFAVTDRPSTRNFLFNDQNRLCGWQNTTTGEKRISIQQERYQPKSYSCVALFQPTIFEHIPQRGKFSLVDTYLSLAEENLIFGYDHTGDKFIDVGKPESVAIAEKLFA